MAITIQTRTEVLNDLRAYLRSRNPDLLTSIDTDEGSILETLAESLYGLQVLLRAVERDAYATTAVGSALDEHAQARLARSPRKGATSARGVGAARITGTDGTVIPSGTTMTHSDGIQYEVETDVTIASGQADATISSVDTGSAANRESGEELTLDSPPAGADATVTLVADVDGAEDSEDDESLRERLLLAYAQPPAGGRFADYRQWALEVSGVEHAYVYGPTDAAPTGRRGLGTVDVAVLTEGTGSNRIPSATLVDRVQDYIDTVRPACVDFLSLTVSSSAQALDITVYAEPGYEYDWTGSAGTVASYTAATKTIQWNAALPSGLEDKVDADGSARIYVSEQVLTVVSYSGVNTVVEETPTTTPSGDIYPAGPITEGVLSAVKALFDSLGPRRPSSADPDHAWEDRLLLSAIYKAVMNVTGVRNVSITTPVADVSPSYVSDTEVEILTEGAITLRAG